MVRDSRKIAAILAADVVDYSRLMGADEAGTLAALAARRSIFEAQVAEFEGRVFGSVGDSLMAEFHSAVHAVQCAQAIQGAVAKENAPLPTALQMRLRIGVNLGDVIEGKDGVAGDAVNVAARLQALAPTVEPVVGDVTDAASLEPLFAGLSGTIDVIHTAGVIHPRRAAEFATINAGGTVVVMATHDLDLVRQTTYRTIEMREGAVVFDSAHDDAAGAEAR